MSVEPTEDIKEIIQDIIRKQGLDPNSEICCSAGSETGDGYLSKTMAVNITKNHQSTNIFLKYALNIKSTDEMPIEKIYRNETYFYEFMAPALSKFARSKGVEDGLTNVPKCYGTSTTNVIALENLKMKGFEMHDMTNAMNEYHIVGVLKAFARYHAISLAYKHENKDAYKEMCGNVHTLLINENSLIAKMQKQAIGDVLSKLDPEVEKYLLNRCENLAERLLDYVRNGSTLQDEYSIITKGDCWSNNIMFSYEENNKEKPTDVMLIDWQIIKPGSVVLDISYFFYTVATKEKLNNLEFYLKLYYKELSEHIRRLGSDPEILYPYSVLEKQWLEHCKYGFFTAFSILRFMFISKEEAPNMEEIDIEDDNTLPIMTPSEEYFVRMKSLIEHMVDNNFI